jgi:Fe-S cluster assembly protein SufD
MSNQSIISILEDQFADLTAKMNGSAASANHAARKNALEAVVNLGLPTRKNEEYKYTPLSTKLDKSFAGFNEAEAKSNKVSAPALPELSGSIIVFANGEYQADLSKIKEEKGVEIRVVQSQKEFKSATSEDIQDSFSKLNLALAATGVEMKVAANTIIENPVHVINLVNTENGRVISTLRHHVEVGENAQASFVEYFMGNGDNASFTNSVVESKVGESAIFNHYKLGLDGDADLRIDNTTCHQQGKSVFNTANVNFGGNVVRNNLNILLDGEYCEANLDGLYLPAYDGLIDNHTVVDHRMPNCESNELYKGIMDENATGVFNGKVFVRQDAQKTNAFQSNKNILLSDTATINTKPQLEIWADDVKCSHGCTTGQLDSEQLFYLRARGIDEPSARKLLLKAFAEEIVERIKLEEVKDIAEALLDERLG